LGKAPGKPLICDTVVVRNFLLAGVIELLRAIAGSPVHVPTLVFNNDSEELPSELRSELRRGIDFHRAKRRSMPQEGTSYQRESLLVVRFESLYDLTARGILIPEELSMEELLRYSDLTNPQYLRDHGLPTRIHRGEAAAIAIAEARGWILATDDDKGYQAATMLGIEARRTRGLLGEAIRLGLLALEEAKRIHTEMRQNDFWDEEWV
jgi:predicted nucleic acid-binding protein